MTTTRDARLNDFIRLKQTPAPPVERWQMVPFTRCSQAVTDRKIPGPAPKNTLTKTPERRLAIRAKTPKTPGVRGHTSIQRTPGLGTLKTPTTTPGRTGQTPSNCRYVPNRVSSDMEYSSFLLTQQCKEQVPQEKGKEGEQGETSGPDSPPTNDGDNQRLLDALSRSRGQKQQRSVLSFKTVTPKLSGSHSYLEEYIEGPGTSACGSRGRPARPDPISPQKVLDAPTIKDDYYLNTLHWGKNNILAVGLDAGVYLWNASDGSTQQLMELEGRDDYVSSLSWSGNGKFLAVGDSTACVTLWDVEKQKKIRSMKAHSDRVGVLAWNKHTLTSASRDGLILYNDVRKADHVVGRSQYHRMEVCGLEWSRDGTKLASGGNDNMACIWSVKNPSEPLQLLKGHEAAVKAVAWCPWEPNTLATGGGSSDKTIKFWNVFTGQCTKTVKAKSQVSSLAWNKHHRQLLSAHGEPRNYLAVWDYPSMNKVSVLCGHRERVLHMALSPHRSRVASASSDETLRIWKCFKQVEHDVSQRSYSEESISALLQSTLHEHH